MADEPTPSTEEAPNNPTPEEAASDTTMTDASADPSSDNEDSASEADDASEAAAETDADRSQETEAVDEATASEKPADDASDDDTDEETDEESAEHRATIEALLKAGSHFGHLTSRWSPRMEEYIFMERNNIHIIDLMQTQVMLDEAAEAAKRFARRGKNILFAGTKKQAQAIVREHAEACDMPHMVERWMGGTMTNFQTIRKSIRRMEEIERMEKDGTLDKLKKKEKLMRMREHEKLERDLGGIRHMANLPGALFVVDVKREDIAVKEAQKLGIPIIAMVDTNGDPRGIDYPVPSNDDALSSIELVTSTIADAIQEGLHERKMKQEANRKAKQTG